MRRIVGAAFGVLVLLAATPASVLASDCEVPPSYRADERPDPKGSPTAVELGILVADIVAIDDVTQTLEGDFIIRKRWLDPRLASLEGCRLQRAEVWFPFTDVLNSNDLTRSRGQFSSDQVGVESGGLVVYHQRFFGSIATYHQLHRFPFDDHEIRLRLTSLDFPADKIRYEVDEEITGLAELLNIPDWRITGIAAGVEETFLIELNRPYSILTLSIFADRNTNFYIWKILLPLTLIVIMSFVVFWVSPERFGPQIGLTATSMLTLIAFQFALSTVLPKVGYFTTMDGIILGSTVLVFGALVEATIASSLVVKGKAELARRIDSICRWSFPSALALFWGIMLL